MNIKQKMKHIALASLLSVGIFAIFVPSGIASAECTNNASTTSKTSSGNSTCVGNNKCGVDTAIIKCDNVTVTEGGTTNNGLWSLLLTAINILTGAVGIAAVGGIVFGAILYTSAGGNADQTKKAIEFLRNVVIGVVAYALMFATLNFIIPGGLF